MSCRPECVRLCSLLIFVTILLSRDPPTRYRSLCGSILKQPSLSNGFLHSSLPCLCSINVLECWRCLSPSPPLPRCIRMVLAGSASTSGSQMLPMSSSARMLPTLTSMSQERQLDLSNQSRHLLLPFPLATRMLYL